MKRIYYKINEMTENCKTKCPIKSKTAYVGSIGCQECTCHKKHNKKENWVDCSHGDYPPSDVTHFYR